jgi:hypothetical protein
VRTLFLLLLLANLLFAAWALWVAPPPPTAGSATPSATGSATIQLLREVPAPEVSQSQGEDLLALDDANLTCVSAGPFLARADAERTAARLGLLGFTVRLRDAREEVRVGHWVRLEGLATREDAENARAALQAAGLSDAYVLTEEGAGTVVSLGVLADADRAAETAAAARAAGFEPRTVDRLRTEDVTWLDVDRQANGGLPAIDELQLAEVGRQPALGLRPCPAAEPAAAVPR